jgi:SAM-dependent methyltransferase
MAAQQLSSQSIAQAYDAVPYPGLAVTRSQPDFLETVARLRGLTPAPAARASVLELGCAVGQNLLPLAERYPEATFVGVDVSPRQIQEARTIASELSLRNVEFQLRDFADLKPAAAKFDYILAQGIYSWVDEPTRERLLAVCREQLAPHGVAFISYKTYPGWRLHDMFRHMMLYDARHATTPAERMQKSHQVLEFLKQCFDEKRALDNLIQEELASLAQLPDAYLWHDHLAPVSHPVLFKDFMAHAGRHQLQLLGEATLGVRPIDVLDPETEQHLAALTSDPIQQEQFRDIVRNRAIRQTLLVHQSAKVAPTMETAFLAGMHLAAAVKPENPPVDLRSDGVSHFTTLAGGRISTPVVLAKAALQYLGEVWPASIPVDDLVAEATSRVQAVGAPPPGPAEIQRLQDNLMQCIVGGVVQASCGPNAYVAKISENPVVSPLARLLATRSEIVTSRRHHAVRFDALDRMLLTLLDGTRNSAALIDGLIAASQRGQLIVSAPGQQTATPEQVRQAFVEAVPVALERLKTHAMLIA